MCVWWRVCVVGAVVVGGWVGGRGGPGGLGDCGLAVLFCAQGLLHLGVSAHWVDWRCRCTCVRV